MGQHNFSFVIFVTGGPKLRKKHKNRKIMEHACIENTYYWVKGHLIYSKKILVTKFLNDQFWLSVSPVWTRFMYVGQDIPNEHVEKIVEYPKDTNERTWVIELDINDPLNPSISLLCNEGRENNWHWAVWGFSAVFGAIEKSCLLCFIPMTICM